MTEVASRISYISRDEIELINASIDFVAWKAGSGRLSPSVVKTFRRLSTSELSHVRVEAILTLAEVRIIVRLRERGLRARQLQRVIGGENGNHDIRNELKKGLADSTWGTSYSHKSILDSLARIEGGDLEAALRALAGQPVVEEAGPAAETRSTLLAENLADLAGRPDHDGLLAPGAMSRALSLIRQISVFELPEDLLQGYTLTLARVDAALLKSGNRRARTMRETIWDRYFEIRQAAWDRHVEVELAIAQAMYTHYQICSCGQSIAWATQSLFHAHGHLEPNDPRTLGVTISLLNCALTDHSENDSYVPIVPFLDTLEELSGFRSDADVLAVLGSLLVSLSAFGNEREALLDRAARYYEWALSIARIQRSARYQDCLAGVATVFFARGNLAMGAQDFRSAEAFYSKAVRYSSTAYKRADESDHARALLYAKILHVRSALKRDAAGEQRAIAIQSRSLRAAAEMGKQIGGLAELTIWVDPSHHAGDFSLVLSAHVEAIENWRDNTTSALEAALAVARHAPLISDPRLIRRILDIALEAVASAVSVRDPRHALRRIQGLSSYAAEFSVVRLNDPWRALLELERGTLLRLRYQQIKGIRSQHTAASFSKMDDEQERRRRISADPDRAPRRPKLLNVSGPVRSDRLAQATGQPVVYLSCTERGGLAVMATPDGDITCRVLNRLNLSVVNAWLDRLSTEGNVPESQEVRGVRGPRGSVAPGRAQVERILQEAAEALSPIDEYLTGSGYRTAHVIPVGQMSGIPWSHVFRLQVNVDPSAALVWESILRETTVGPPIAIGSPDPCVYAGEEFPPLPGAQEEATWLRMEFGCQTLSGGEATREAFLAALGSGAEFVHVGTHGHVDPTAWGEDAHLLWSSLSGPTDENTVSFQDLMEAQVSCDLVFLATCWGGSPNRSLPDEGISLPAALLARGARTVIAPLWPIDDDVASYLVKRFYRHWKVDGMNVRGALAAASEDTRTHPDFAASSTWAAFAVSGSSDD
ncbi:CHAT domain-containing protein [Humibacillus xanthopallidus]|nr:CHAT domain-containing protein [Humibacillus xanthopallidus]